MPSISSVCVERAIDITMEDDLSDPGELHAKKISSLEKTLAGISLNEQEDDIFDPIFTTIDELSEVFGGDISFVKATPSSVSPEFISKIWSIKEDDAKRVLEENNLQPMISHKELEQVTDALGIDDYVHTSSLTPYSLTNEQLRRKGSLVCSFL